MPNEYPLEPKWYHLWKRYTLVKQPWTSTWTDNIVTRNCLATDKVTKQWQTKCLNKICHHGLCTDCAIVFKACVMNIVSKDWLTECRKLSLCSKTFFCPLATRNSKVRWSLPNRCRIISKRLHVPTIQWMSSMTITHPNPNKNQHKNKKNTQDTSPREITTKPAKQACSALKMKVK